MAKGDKWEQQHIAHLAQYEQEIRTIYNKYIEEATRIASSTGALGDKPFAFADYPLAHSRMKELQRKMAADIKAVITTGTDKEWELSEEKTIELINRVYGDIGEEVIETYRQAYEKRREAARTAFDKRRSEGLNLSNRVWQYTGQFKEELEMALDIGIRDGKSADELSRDVRRYLNNPNMLFRRVRDEHGVLHLSKRAKAYHPGQGVYRSSYKNARRLTATETNIAYRNAEQSAWQALDFVVGQKIQLSNNHTLNGEPFVDICDHLQGNYPKDFVFTGWHPLCRCFATAILMTPEERQENSRRRLKGLPPIAPEDSKNYVGDVPDAFKAWCRLNAGRVERTKSVPYFIKDNQKYYDAAFKKKALTPLELAEQRHDQRTPEHIEDIKNMWYGRQMRRIEVEKIRQEYLDTKGEHIFFDERTGGYVIANVGRYEQRLKSKQEQLKFDKEIGMCRVLATNGRRVILLDEDVRVSSPDILLNGKTAELKKLSSHNNILKEAKDAIRKKNAQFVVFEFEERTDAIWRELQKLRALNIRCIVYFADNQRKLYAI